MLVAGDLVCALLAYQVVLGARWWWGGYVPWFEVLFSAGLVLAWPVALSSVGAYRGRVQAGGLEEVRLVFNGGFGLAAAVAIGAYVTKLMIARSIVLAMLPLAILLTLVFRRCLRRWLSRRDPARQAPHGVVAVGHRTAVLDLVMQLRAQPRYGMRVVAACLPGGTLEQVPDVDGVPILGDFTAVADVVAVTSADAVAVLACPELDGTALRRLAWSLEVTDTDLFVAPSLMEVAGPRISVRPVAGMTLLHVDHPSFGGINQLVKNVFDRVMAATALIVLAIPMLAIFVAVRFTSEGPGLFRHTRVGRGGREFQVLKFRTMVDGADRPAGPGLEGPLVKHRDDPRVTRMGTFLRRYSLDELPQLVNVVRGEMSLVGPRPLVPAEFALYGADIHRRLVVRPGMTGLWQVSGRSDLSWEERMRMDLRYVENWSLTLDLQLLWKTWGAVARARGAY
ncbi:exopolysaccharide biosynthesis polyprenyl glycosylphosphotransferase [Streptosporangium violaceochromogenes]|nr:exopolysaccharide biosynthesis polyprenyl glycosylphosphotransferase [Streptosporangium violaceochromogenes]